jgi:hypothetical protein
MEAMITVFLWEAIMHSDKFKHHVIYGKLVILFKLKKNQLFWCSDESLAIQYDILQTKEHLEHMSQLNMTLLGAD